jgi:raffinose/stachyose/melibiose transport system substrate-binding protein
MAAPRGTSTGRWLAASLLVAIVALAAALGAQAKSQRHADVTIEAVITTTYQQAMDLIIQNFNRVYPNIHVHVQYVDAGSLAALAQTEFRAGNGPDMLQLVPGYGNPIGMLNYADQGYLLDLAPQPWNARLTQPERVGIQQGKHVWGASTGLTVLAYMYNKDLFAQLGVKVPKTWADVIADCPKFTAAKKVMFLQPGGDSVWGGTWINIQAGSDVFGADPGWSVKRALGKTSFATSNWRRAMEQFVEAKNSGCFSPGASGVNIASARASFANGAGGILPNFGAGIGVLTSVNPNLKIGFLPGFADKASDAHVVAQPSLRISVNAKTSHKSETLKFVNFVMRPKQSDTMGKSLGAVFSGYALKTKVFPTWLTPYYGSTILPLLKAGRYTINPTNVWPNASVNVALFQANAGLLTGQYTIDKALGGLDAAFNKGKG